MSETWFISGCSAGLGRAIAKHVLSLGKNVVVTARSAARVADIVVGHEDHALGLDLDLTKPATIEAALKAAHDRFGQIDVIVNNAGSGCLGAFEECDLGTVREMFELNVWGLVGLTRAVLPEMRRRRSGKIINISSIGGLRAFPGLGFYEATKFAVEALSESLAKEVAPLGIQVLIVEPSAFRTEWAGRASEEATSTIEDYDATAGAMSRAIRALDGRQSGDPERAAKAILQALEAPQPPLRLLLGKSALISARAKLEEMRHDFDTWADVTVGADFPNTPPT